MLRPLEGASMMRRSLVVALVLLVLGVTAVRTQQRAAGDMVARIRAEGLQRSRALALYRTLTDEIGARLTGSPARPAGGAGAGGGGHAEPRAGHAPAGDCAGGRRQTNPPTYNIL